MSQNFPVDPGGAAMFTRYVLFRVDAGQHIGLGHLQRCLSLAIALHRLGATCVFLSNGDSTVQNRVTAFGFEPVRLGGVELGGAEDLKHTLAVAVQYRCDAVVVDSYHIDADYLGRLRGAELFVVAIDDLACYPFPCQLVVNGCAHAQRLPYCSSSGNTQFLLGPQYALLRPDFWDVPPRTMHETVQNILVTLGGADPHNLMPRFLSLLDDLAGDFTVTAIVGPFFENRAEVEAISKDCERSVRLVYNSDSMRDLMVEADLAISAGGQTLYELAATGTPSVAVQVADNQADSLQALAAEGVVRVAGCVDEDRLLANVRATVRELLGSRDVRVEMSAAGERLVDGRGALQVGEILVDMLPVEEVS